MSKKGTISSRMVLPFCDACQRRMLIEVAGILVPKRIDPNGLASSEIQLQPDDHRRKSI
jgi:hypothetical protein